MDGSFSVLRFPGVIPKSEGISQDFRRVLIAIAKARSTASTYGVPERWCPCELRFTGSTPYCAAPGRESREIRLIATKKSTSSLASAGRKTTQDTGTRGTLASFSLISLLLVAGVFVPGSARAASVNELFTGFFSVVAHAQKEKPVADAANLQTIVLPKAAMNIDPNPSKGGGDITIVDDSALLPDEGPSGTGADIIERPKNDQISIYVVRSGDTLVGIGKLFGVSPNTILWANNMTRASALRVGQTLTILPVTGVQYTVKKGDTLASIAKKYHGDVQDIANFNGIEGELSAGDVIIIPDGEIAAVPNLGSGSVSSVPRGSLWKKVVNLSATDGEYAGYYIRPIVGGVKTQGIHGYNGVDLAAPVGTPIIASASGDVIVARDSGWNGGYGEYVVILHSNGTQTLYAHASQVIVGVGQHVVQGQVIAYVGRTGRATGSHIHFEIRGGPRNPF